MSTGIRTAMTIGCGALLSACASIVSDNDTTTHLQTEPEVARCELRGKDLDRVVHTPHSVNLPASAAPITVACKADGYRTATAELDTSMDGWIFGNILLGGVVGIAVDLVRGAGQKFPPQLTVILEPEQFASPAARDEWFNGRKKKIDEKWDEVVKEIKTSCADEVSGCEGALEKAENQRAKELEQVEERRLGARVGAT